MNFTDKEIQLARDMKEAGVVWIKREYGDWYISLDINEPTTGYLPDMLSDDSVWLPLWHQCREILAGSGIRINLDEQHWNDGNPVDLCCWRKKEAGITFIGSIKADTDLDAMYQAILMYVLDAPRTADDDETSN